MLITTLSVALYVISGLPVLVWICLLQSAYSDSSRMSGTPRITVSPDRRTFICEDCDGFGLNPPVQWFKNGSPAINVSEWSITGDTVHFMKTTDIALEGSWTCSHDSLQSSPEIKFGR